LADDHDLGGRDMSAHTPGPWFIEDYGDEDAPPSSSTRIARAGFASWQRQDRLAIQRKMRQTPVDRAAPDLLEALKALLPEGWGDDDRVVTCGCGSLHVSRSPAEGRS